LLNAELLNQDIAFLEIEKMFKINRIAFFPKKDR